MQCRVTHSHPAVTGPQQVHLVTGSVCPLSAISPISPGPCPPHTLVTPILAVSTSLAFVGSTQKWAHVVSAFLCLTHVSSSALGSIHIAPSPRMPSLPWRPHACTRTLTRAPPRALSGEGHAAAPMRLLAVVSPATCLGAASLPDADSITFGEEPRSGLIGSSALFFIL